MLDCIGNESVLARDPGVFERGVKNAPCWPDERLARQIFLVAGLFAHQHELGLFRTFTRHRLSGVAVERTTPALALGRRQRAQRFDRLARIFIHLPVHEGGMPKRRKRSKAGYKGIFMSLL